MRQCVRVTPGALWSCRLFWFCLVADAEGLVAKLKSLIGFDLPYEDQIEVRGADAAPPTGQTTQPPNPGVHGFDF